MHVEIDGVRYVESRPHYVCDYFGTPLYYGAIIWDSSKEHFSIALSSIEFKGTKVYFVGQDKRKILFQNSTLDKPHQIRYVKTA